VHSNTHVVNNFSTLDIETISINNVEVPVAISLVMSPRLGKGGEVEKYFFTIDKSRLKYVNGVLEIDSLESEIIKMWRRLFKTLTKKASEGNDAVKYIFVHNLGSFDGYFIFKYFTQFFENKDFNTIIDNQNKFISINFNIDKYKTTIKFIDSYRIFPVSLEELCKIFSVQGKTMKYDKDNFHSLSLFYDSTLFKLFKEYSIQDSKALYQALEVAQIQYFENYKVDITTVVSASSLALKIFRTKYLTKNIPIPNLQEDNFIRHSYFGGATDVYKAKGVNLKYIDVNSLYPLAMLNKMPFTNKGYISDMTNIKLDDFFGFIKVEVTCPTSVLRPLLPYRINGRTIFPNGKWIATYFSEEIKAVLPKNLGYQFKLISGYDFTSQYLFNNYVKDLYRVKQEAKGSVRFIAKLLLNTLYGIFGRKLENTEVLIINKKDLDIYFATREILIEIPLDSDKIVLIVRTNSVPIKTLEKLNITINSNTKDKPEIINSNVAIAAAITAYARIHMMDIKLHESCYYTDTDSAVRRGG
jgi:hypothetical protein